MEPPRSKQINEDRTMYRRCIGREDKSAQMYLLLTSSALSLRTLVRLTPEFVTGDAQNDTTSRRLLCGGSEPAENTCQLPRFHIMPGRKMLSNQDHGAYRPRDRSPSRPYPDRERLEERTRAEAWSRPARALPRDRDRSRERRRRASPAVCSREARNHRLRQACRNYPHRMHGRRLPRPRPTSSGRTSRHSRPDCEAKTLYNLIHRRGYSHYGKDLLSLRQICSHFCVRYSKVISCKRARADPYIR
jgi:hypothetical protein